MNGGTDTSLPSSTLDLCVCGPMTRYQGLCDCAPSESETVLQEADRITNQQRRDKYGPPAVDFAKVQGMAKALWGRGPEDEAEHALYMVFVKLAREQHSHQRDNIVDAIGYLKCYWEIVSTE